MSEQANISSTYTTLEVNKGRTELRSVMVSDGIEDINKEWVGLRQLVKVHRRRKDNKGKQQEETAYFISSLSTNALDYMKGIRQHWGIENGLHYVKDVVMKEDASTIRMGNAPQNLSAIRNVSLNLLRTNKSTSMTQAIRLTANDITGMKKMII